MSITNELPLEKLKSETNNLEDTFQQLFSSSASSTGEEELLRIASAYSRQYSSAQMRVLLYLRQVANYYLRKESDNAKQSGRDLCEFLDRWEELKQYNNSDVFVMKALEHISLRRFINENSVKVNIEK